MRNHAGRAILTIAACASTFVCVVAAQAQILVHDGQSDYFIVSSPDASPSEKFAAEELQEHFHRCTGVEWPVVTERPTAAPMIVLGCGPVAESLGVQPDPASLGEQGYALRTVGNHLVIAGTPAAGTLYGVCDFLEACLGVRWYAPGTRKTPKVTELLLPDVNRLVTPAFRWRHTSYAWPGRDAAFLARNRDNSGGGLQDHRYGVQCAFDGRCHSYFRYLDPAKYFDEHPEYFSEIGGVRLRHDTQLCLTNPDVLEIVADKMLARMAAMPGVRQHNFSQMDWYNYCECADCRKMNERSHY